MEQRIRDLLGDITSRELAAVVYQGELQEQAKLVEPSMIRIRMTKILLITTC